MKRLCRPIRIEPAPPRPGGITMTNFFRKAGRIVSAVTQATREARYLQGARTTQELVDRMEKVRSGKFA